MQQKCNNTLQNFMTNIEVQFPTLIQMCNCTLHHWKNYKRGIKRNKNNPPEEKENKNMVLNSFSKNLECNF